MALLATFARRLSFAGHMALCGVRPVLILLTRARSQHSGVFDVFALRWVVVEANWFSHGCVVLLVWYLNRADDYELVIFATRKANFIRCKG